MAWSSPRTWVTGETVTAAQMNQEVRDNLDFVLPDGSGAASWSPVLEATTTDPTVGSVTGGQYQVGAVMKVWVRFVIGAGASPGGSGTFFVELPVASSGITASTGLGQVLGTYHARDVTNTTNNMSGAVWLAGTGPSIVYLDRVTSTTPFSWAENDVLSFSAEYPVA